MDENVADRESPIRESCASCGAKLKGDYCRKCGEKKIIPERDFSLRKFLSLTLWHLVHFDSKLLLSCWLLFSKPGFLTSEWIAGRRVRYMKPFQLFVFASVLFYFFLPTTTAYFTGSRDLIVGFEMKSRAMNLFQFDYSSVLAEKSKALQTDVESLNKQVLTAAAQHSKAGLILIIPFWGALVFFFFHKRIPWLAPHFIFAMHGLIAYVLTDLVIHAIMFILSLQIQGKDIYLILSVFFSVYLVLAVHRVYSSSLLVSILKTLGISISFIAIMMIYRQLVTISALVFF